MLKYGYKVWVVMVDGKVKAVFDNLAPAEKYIERNKLENAIIDTCQYLM